MLITTINLNEEQREEVERSLAEAVQTYVRFNSHPSIEAFNEHIIKAYQLSLVSVGRGSVIVTVECLTLKGLELLWRDYLSGELDKVAEQCFVTDKTKKKLNLETICLKTIIEKENYLSCWKALKEVPSTHFGEYKQNVWEVHEDLHYFLNTVKVTKI